MRLKKVSELIAIWRIPEHTLYTPACVPVGSGITIRDHTYARTTNAHAPCLKGDLEFTTQISLQTEEEAVTPADPMCACLRVYF